MNLRDIDNVLDLFFISKPLSNSAFSEKLILQLWEKYKIFHKEKMMELNQINHLQEKYDRIFKDYPETEKNWVMDNKMIEMDHFLKNIKINDRIFMEELQMCFKPKLHEEVEKNYNEILNRFIYWLNQYPELEKTFCLYKPENWDHFAFHVQIFDDHSCLLIDKKSKTFEYYNPKGKEPEMKIKILLNEIKQNIESIFPDFQKEYRMIRMNKPFYNNNTDSNNMMIYVILFLYSRVILNETFESITENKIPKEKCENLKTYFFEVQEKKLEKEKELKINKKVMSTIIINRIRFMQFLFIIQNISDYPQLEKDLNHKFIFRCQVDDIHFWEKEVDDYMNQKLKEYNLMISIKDLIDIPLFQDPIQKKLINIKKDVKARKFFILKKFKEISTDWMAIEQDPNSIQLFEQYISTLLYNYYIPIIYSCSSWYYYNLSIDDKINKLDMTVEKFLENCTYRPELFYLAGHFIRNIRHFVVNELKKNVFDDKEDKINYQHFFSRHISHNNCLYVIEKAKSLIAEFKLLKMSNNVNITPPSSSSSIPQQQQPPPEPIRIIIITPEIKNKTTITNLIWNDLKQKTFLPTRNSLPQPWNFPINPEMIPYDEEVYIYLYFIEILLFLGIWKKYGKDYFTYSNEIIQNIITSLQLHMEKFQQIKYFQQMLNHCQKEFGLSLDTVEEPIDQEFLKKVNQFYVEKIKS